MDYQGWTGAELAAEAERRGLHKKRTIEDQIDILLASDESAKRVRLRQAKYRSRYRSDIGLCLTFLTLRLILVWFFLHPILEALWDWLEGQGIDFGAQGGVLYIETAQYILWMTLMILVVGTVCFFRENTRSLN